MWSKRNQLDDLRASQTTEVGGALDVDIPKQMCTDLSDVIIKALFSRYNPPANYASEPPSHCYINYSSH